MPGRPPSSVTSVIPLRRATCVFREHDGWKGEARPDEIRYVYAKTDPLPFPPGQHPIVGEVDHVVRADRWRLEPVTWRELLRLIPRLWHDLWHKPTRERRKALEKLRRQG